MCADGAPPLAWHCAGRVLDLAARPVVMAILNVTPDSFSDGGTYATVDAAIGQGLRFAREGARILDVGGESTRPGAEPVSEAVESARVLPVVAGLVRSLRERGLGEVLVSVDTCKAAVAQRALAAGASIVNDVTALGGDPAMAAVVRDSGAGLVLMHMRGRPRTMQNEPGYADVASEVEAFLRARVAHAGAAGIARAALCIDPGIGFGKTLEHNVALLGATARLVALGLPVLVGVSRKSFLGTLTGRAVGERLAGSLAAALFAAQAGARVLRVHEARETVDALRVWRALQAGEYGPVVRA